MMLRWLLGGLSLYAIIIGLWDHDWPLILAGIACAILPPFTYQHAHE